PAHDPTPSCPGPPGNTLSHIIADITYQTGILPAALEPGTCTRPRTDTEEQIGLQSNRGRAAAFTRHQVGLPRWRSTDRLLSGVEDFFALPDTALTSSTYRVVQMSLSGAMAARPSLPSARSPGSSSHNSA